MPLNLPPACASTPAREGRPTDYPDGAYPRRAKFEIRNSKLGACRNSHQAVGPYCPLSSAFCLLPAVLRCLWLSRGRHCKPHSA
jgi:hypothetical protein